MARVVFPPPKLSIDNVRLTCINELGFDPLLGIPSKVLQELDLRVPFIVGKHGGTVEPINRYLRLRADGEIVWLSERELSEKTLKDYANDLKIFFEHFDEPNPGRIKENIPSFRKRYKHDLRKSNLSASTVNRRFLVADAFLSFLESEKPEVIKDDDVIDEKFQRAFKNFSGQRINHEIKISVQARRRNPSSLSILTPAELLRFFSAFEDRTLAASAKIIYATGMRRSEVSAIKAGDILKIKLTSPSAAAKLRVLGKGQKERTVELESALLAGLRSYIGSDHRLKRAQLWARKNSASPYSDAAPLLMNRFGDSLTGPAIGDAFLRASNRCDIKRSPHELRSEFAVAYLLDKYRAVAARLERSQFDAWMTRLMVDRASLTLLRLSQLLGHSSVETTRKYLSMLIGTEVGIRDSWCEHLDGLGAGILL